MTARRIDGQRIAAELRAGIAAETAELTAANGIVPGLAAVLVGDNPASAVYVRNKAKACPTAGMNSSVHRLPADTTQGRLLEVVAALNADPSVSGILVQLPLPGQIDESAIIRAIDPAKDVDCFHPENLGLLAAGQPRFLPCTPYGVVRMLERECIETRGKNVVIVGRSNIVGKPLALMMMQKRTASNPAGGDATVTVAHSGTKDLSGLLRTADIIVAAVGIAGFVKPDMVAPGAVVVDVGINRVGDKLVGDVDAGVWEVASAMTPVPGGVGPMTITMLLHNTLAAARTMAPNPRIS